jgi:hypothetical protein
MGHRLSNHPRGGVTGVVPQVASSGRSVTLLQRKTDPVGKTLGRTTGWTHRATLARRGVRMVNGVEYLKVDDAGLHVRVQRRAAAARGGHGDRLRRPAAAARSVRRTARRRASRLRWWAARSKRRSWMPSARSTRPAGWRRWCEKGESGDISSFFGAIPAWNGHSLLLK